MPGQNLKKWFLNFVTNRHMNLYKAYAPVIDERTPGTQTKNINILNSDRILTRAVVHCLIKK